MSRPGSLGLPGRSFEDDSDVVPREMAAARKGTEFGLRSSREHLSTSGGGGVQGQARHPVRHVPGTTGTVTSATPFFVDGTLALPT